MTRKRQYNEREGLGRERDKDNSRDNTERATEKGRERERATLTTNTEKDKEECVHVRTFESEREIDDNVERATHS